MQYERVLFTFTVSSGILTSMKKQKLLEEQVGEILRKKKKNIALAESCTGGLVSSKITDIPGSSDYFLGSIISYSNDVKITMLDVSPELINKYGSVSKEVAKAMAVGIRDFLDTDFAISVTGIAGPSGGTKAKAVGLVYVGFASRKTVKTKKVLCAGDRLTVKEKFAQVALKVLLENIK